MATSITDRNGISAELHARFLTSSCVSRMGTHSPPPAKLDEHQPSVRLQCGAQLSQHLRGREPIHVHHQDEIQLVLRQPIGPGNGATSI
jgi:hypothetical protein